MSGLIWGGALQGIGAGAQTVGRQSELERAQREAIALRAEEARALAAQRDAATNARWEDRLAMQKEIAELKANGGAGGGVGTGGKMPEPGSMAFAAMANEMGMSEPELSKFLKAKATGDMSGYAKTEANVGPTEDGGALPGVKTMPAGHDKYVTEKSAILLKIQKDFIQGKNRKEIAEGRETDQKAGLVAGVIDGTVKAPVAAEAIAAGKGDGAYGQGGVNQFTGTADAVGKSTINKNNADAGESSAKGAAATAGSKDQVLASLTQERVSADKSVAEARAELQALRAGEQNVGRAQRPAHDASVKEAKDKLTRYENERDDLKKRIQHFTTTAPSGRGKLPTETDSGNVGASNPPKASATGGLPKPKSAAERDALKPGTRYVAPDGTLKIKG